MAFFSPTMRPAAQAVAAFLLASPALAQQAGTLKPVTVSGTAAPQPDIAGFGDVPARELPLSVTIVPAEKLQDAGVRRLSDITRLDASTTDSYNSAGYWDFISVRGFTLDNRYNYRREGLPISAETSIPLDNKERIEILKGTSGLQAGTSAPGGLVNYTVKRPPAQAVRKARVEISERGSVLGAVDLGGRAGDEGRFGWRLNAAHEQLRPELRDANGSRSLLALAADWRLTKDTVVDAEIEWSRRAQQNQPAFSLLGAALPVPTDPRINLNNQPWSSPTRFEGLTGTVRLEQALSRDWRWSLQAGSQQLRTDDRLAFPFGCGAEGSFDRFCSDGTYDMYDYRSDDERRTVRAVKAQVQGRVETGAVRHDLTFGMLRSTAKERFNRQAFNYVGTGNIEGSLVTPADPTLTGESTNRDERSTELFAYDAIGWQQWRAWLGARHTRIDRSSIRTDGSAAVDYSQSFTTPWLGLSYAFAGNTVVYASAGQGIESRVTPGLPGYGASAGQPLPALKSRQVEIGARGGESALAWSAALFRIERPAVADTGTTFQFDGEALHRGLEAAITSARGAWRFGASAMLLDAENRGSTVNAANNGLKPMNVPSHTLRAEAGWRVLPGVELDARLVREGRRAVLADNSIMLPAWNRVDAGVTWTTKAGGTELKLRAAVDNVADKRYWRESPFQFGHAYLYPGAPRTFRVSLDAAI